MLYARSYNGKLVSDTQMVSVPEHLLLEHRVLFLTGVLISEFDVGGIGMAYHSGENISNTLLALDSLNHETIKLVVSSPGGSLDGLFLITDTLSIISSPVEILGRQCASAAALLLSAGKKRYLLPHSKVMLHLPSGAMRGDSRDFKIQSTLMERYEDDVVELLQKHGVKRTKKEILFDINRDFWLSPVEAIEYGLADEIITTSQMTQWLTSSNIEGDSK